MYVLTQIPSQVLTQGARSVSAYFPAAYWYSIAGGVFNAVPIDASSAGRQIELPTALTDTNVHVRGGSIIPMQDSAMTTTAARATPFTLAVFLCPLGNAKGTLFWDDGEQVAIQNYLVADYVAHGTGSTGSVSTSSVQSSYDEASSFIIDTIEVFGPNMSCPSASAVTLNAQPFEGSVKCEQTAVGGVAISFQKVGVKLADTFALKW